ncbi:hypothetical protein HYU09_00855 [Candidatus Woesearchaeota archaeon]|nr:hypothetical protein [Candidatus Woesearchaeota archaeon]
MEIQKIFPKLKKKDENNHKGDGFEEKGNIDFTKIFNYKKTIDIIFQICR